MRARARLTVHSYARQLCTPATNKVLAHRGLRRCEPLRDKYAFHTRTRILVYAVFCLCGRAVYGTAYANNFVGFFCAANLMEFAFGISVVRS